MKKYRDWWDDYDLDFDSFRRPRTSRLSDQFFGTTLRKNDLLSSLANTHIGSGSRTPYFRPWNVNDITRQDSGVSAVSVEKDKFQIILDVQQFTPDEISVKTNDKYIIVEGKHEEKQDGEKFSTAYYFIILMNFNSFFRTWFCFKVRSVDI